MQTTTHYNLQKPDPNDTYNKATDNANMDAIDAQMYANAQAAANGIPYAVDTSAAANTVTAAITPAPASYTDGLAVCVKVANTSTGAATLNLNNLGAVPIHNGDGSVVGSGDLVSGVPVTLRYVGGASPAFIASGSGGLSGTGNATAADVLEPYTFTSASGKKQAGAMPNNGALGTIEPGTAAQNIPAGYTSGGQVAGDANLVSANIKSGASIFGIAGKASVVDTGDATASASQILTGQSAYVNGAKVAGSMPNKGGVIITPSNADQVIAQGYHDGTGKVSAVTFDATKVLTGTTIASTPGTMPNNGQKIITPGTAQQAIAQGYHDGTGYVKGDANLLAANILSGKSIFGVAGSLIPGTPYASGTAVSGTTASQFTNSSGGANTYSAYQLVVSGLTFTPTKIIIYIGGANFDITLYVANFNFSQNAAAPIYNSGSSGGNQYNGYYELVAPLSVSATGFTLPVARSGTTYNWSAYAN